MEKKMNWREYVRAVEPYTPGEQPKDENVIKLNTNENPYGPSDKVKSCVQDLDLLRKYPDPAASDLVEAIASYHGVEPGQVFVGVGSDDVLGMAFLTFFNSERPILFPDITYSFYPVWAELYKIPYRTKALTEDFRILPEDYKEENGGVVFPNPNAPTARLMELSSVEEIIRSNKDSIVIVDEAYIDFAPEGSSALSLVDRYDNLLVVRTFSKSRSMAGLRIGYAIGQKELIDAMQAVKYSYNSYTMNRPSILYGCASIQDEEYFRSTVERIIRTRDSFAAAMEGLGFRVIPSAANFVFVEHETIPAVEIFEKAREAGIYFRHFRQPGIDNFLRITIGTEEEMETVIKFLTNLT